MLTGQVTQLILIQTDIIETEALLLQTTGKIFKALKVAITSDHSAWSKKM